jgi:adenosylhomocysteine nucleosidase
LLAFAAECGATLVGQFYSAERVVGRAEEKRYLGEHSDAVDMESFEILLESAAFGIPAIAIRAISDTVDDDLPLDMNRILTDEGQVSIPRVLGQVAMHPASVPDLVRLGRNSKTAAESLAQFLDKFVATLSQRFQTLERRAGVAAPLTAATGNTR